MALVASVRPDGWWLPAWFAGLVPAVFGLESIALPGAASTADSVWGVAFVAAAELTQDEEVPSLLGRRLADRGQLHEPGRVVDLEHDELLAGLRVGGAPAPGEVAARVEYRTTHDDGTVRGLR